MSSAVRRYVVPLSCVKEFLTGVASWMDDIINKADEVNKIYAETLGSSLWLPVIESTGSDGSGMPTRIHSPI